MNRAEDPEGYICPISLQLMDNPVLVNGTHLFDRNSILTWIAMGGTKNPMTNLEFETITIEPQLLLRQNIKAYKHAIVRQQNHLSQKNQVQNLKICKKNENWFQRASIVSETMEAKKIQIKRFKENFTLWKSIFDEQIILVPHNLHRMGQKFYIGQMKSGKRHGKGICFYPDGSMYEGEWFHGFYHGKGIFTTCTRKREYGEWKLGELHGIGIYQDEAGCIYEGDLKYGSLSGRGVAYREGQLYFEGEWKNGLRHGRGIRYMDEGKFEGEWKNGLRHGYGQVTFTSSSAIHQKWMYGQLIIESNNIRQCFL